ncbi:MAG: hypothetical protein ACOX2R_00405 [Anaerolineae bacterium]|jgi:DNA-directed RNA polymerase specialized sigma24 family protein
MTSNDDFRPVEIVAGDRTYAFSVQQRHNGRRYLIISETQTVGRAYDHHQIAIPEEHLPSFAESLRNVREMLGQDVRAYSIAKIRETHPRAYAKWSPEEEAQLRERYLRGASVSDLAERFERQPGAIAARLARLGLL